VLLANGEPLVSSGRAATLSVRDGNPNPAQIDIVLSRGNSEAEITGLLGDGALGGLFTYRDDVLEPVRAEIGRLAIVLTHTMNEQHRQGMDLDGNMGTDLFSPIKKGNFYGSNTNETAVLNANLYFYDPTQLTGSDYEVEIVGVNQVQIKRLSDGRYIDPVYVTPTDFANQSEVPTLGRYTVDTAGSKQVMTIQLEGFTFTLSSTEIPKTGDLFLLQPTVSGSRDMNLALTNPKMLAMASPLRVTPAATNGGNAELVSIEVLDYSGSSPLRAGELAPPVEIVFNAPDASAFTVYNISDPLNPQVYKSMSDIAYTPGESIVIETLANQPLFQVTLNNTAKPGDRFAIEYNTDGYSDNRNAVALAALQQQETALNKSYQDAYGQLLAKVGTQANSIAVGYSANRTVLAASEDALESVRGVNLDEEATKLIQYQQAYTASTRLITAYQDLFDSLISAVR